MNPTKKTPAQVALSKQAYLSKQAGLPEEDVPMTKKEVAARLRLSTSQFDRLREDKEAGFPEGVRVYGRKLIWRKAEVLAYLEALFAARDRERAA